MANLTRPPLNGRRHKRTHPVATRGLQGLAVGSTALPEDEGGDGGFSLPTALAASYRSIVGSFCQKHRKAAGMTQAQVGDIIGVGHTAISGYETGRGQLPPGRYDKLADLYGLDRPAYGKFLLRYTNPWIYALLYGNDSRSLARDLGYPVANRYKLASGKI